MIEFVDPRSNPAPPARVSREPVAHGEELRELTQSCLAGRVYDVERWIREGRPIQALSYKRPKRAPVMSPLRAAIRKKHRDLVLLLLCNGYRLDLEDQRWNSLLDEALTIHAFDILELLLAWGADPTTATAYQVINTYKSDLIDRFWAAGLDYAKDSEFVSYLAHTVNKPLYGWLRGHRSDPRLQDVLDVALLETVVEDEELTVRLLLWAGANPHRRAPTARELHQPSAWTDDALWSSAEAAIAFGRHALFDLLRVGTMPDLEAQAAHAHDAWTLKKVVALRAPTEWSAVILAFMRRLSWPGQSGSVWDVRDALGFIASQGGRLTSVTPSELRYLRRELLEVREPDDFLWHLRWLKKEKQCDPAIYAELTRTDSMRKKMEAAGAGTRYLSPSQRQSQAATRRRRRAAQKAAP